MRKADRLFEIIQFLRAGRLITAEKLAERLEVSKRTIYRDIANLQSTGVPIEGEAGMGYIMRDGFDLPPLMFSRDEIVALVVGAKMVKTWGGISMARAAVEAIVKIEAVLPETERNRIDCVKIYTPPMTMQDDLRSAIDLAEAAIDVRDIILFDYKDKNNISTSRSVQPLGLWFWGKDWTLVAWCELRDDFRMFRLDRMQNLKLAGQKFIFIPERSLVECLRQLEVKDARKSN